MRRVLYLDLVGGAAGDMLMAALVDAGASLDRVREAVAAVGIDVAIDSRVDHPAGLRAMGIDVVVPHHHIHEHEHEDHHHHHRPYRLIREKIEAAEGLPAGVRAMALQVFHRLAVAEGEAHGVAPDDVEFHEVGSDDAIADIIGVATALHELAFDEVVVSPVPVARGLTVGAHGPIPLPGPATLSLLLGAPLVQTPLEGETVTPTGAALLMTIADRFGPIPSMTLEVVGVGGGRRTWPDRPNIVRALIGVAAAGAEPSADDVVVEANLDDMTPEHVAELEAQLRATGAHDVWSTAIRMKKGRGGVLVSALVRRTELDAVSTTFFTHSTTLGVRATPVTRVRAERHVETVQTEYGEVRVKVSRRPVGPPLVMPEHDDCARLAAEARVPIRLVHDTALRAYSG